MADTDTKEEPAAADVPAPDAPDAGNAPVATSSDAVEDSGDAAVIEEKNDDAPAPAEEKRGGSTPKKTKAKDSARDSNGAAGGTEEFPPGSIVWAKLFGHPWWPARVEADDGNLGEFVTLHRKPNTVPVLFCGSRDYGWVTQDNLKSFEEYKDKLKSKKTAKFLQAVEEASNPSLLADQDERNAARNAPKTPKRRSSAETASSRKKAKKAAATEDDDDDNEETKTPSSKARKRAAKEPGSTAKKARKRKQAIDEDQDAEDGEDEVKSVPKKRQRKSSSGPPAEEEDDEKSKEKALRKLLKIRSKLQTFMKELDEKNGELEDEAFEAAIARLKEIDEFPLTLQLMKDSKVGKLVKMVSKLKIDDDRFNVKGTAHTLMQKLSTQLVRPETDEPRSAAPESEETRAAAASEKAEDEPTPMEGATTTEAQEEQEDKSEPATPAGDRGDDEVAEAGKEAETAVQADTQLEEGAEPPAPPVTSAE